jgi:hypothetical protein
MLVFVATISMNLEVDTQFAPSVGEFTMAKFSEDYELDSTTTFEAIVDELSGTFYTRPFDPPHYYEGSYGCGIYEPSTGGNAYRFSGVSRKVGVELQSVSDRQDITVTAQMTAFLKVGAVSTASANIGLLCTDGEETYILMFSLNGSNQLYFSLFDLSGNAYTTFKGPVSISAWTFVAGGIHIEVTLNLHMIKADDNYQLRPTITIYNLEDDTTYLWDDMSADRGTGDELACWFNNEIVFYGAVRYVAGYMSYVTWEKVTLQ